MRHDPTPFDHSTSIDITAVLDPLDRSQVDSAMRAATRRVAPLWQLESFVAVNPYVGLTDMTFSDAARRLDLVAGARSALPDWFYLDALDAGRISVDDLSAAATRTGDGDGAELDELMSGARSAPRPPRRHGEEAIRPAVRTFAEVAAEVTGMEWSTFMIERVAAWAAAHFDSGQAMWRSADRSDGAFAGWRREASVDRTPDVMGLRGFRAHVRALPEDPVEASVAALAALGVTGESIELYLHALLLRLSGWAGFAARMVFEAELAGRSDDTAVELLAVLVCWDAALLAALDDPRVPEAWRAACAVSAAAARTERTPALRRSLVLQEAFDLAEQRRLIDVVSAPVDRRDGVADADGGRSDRARAQVVFCIDVRSEVMRRQLESVAPDVATIGFAGFFGIAIEYVPLAHAHGLAQCPVLLRPGHRVLESIPDPRLRTEAIEGRGRAHAVRRSWKSFKMGAISCFSFVGPVGLVYLPKLFSDGFGRTRPVRRAETEGISPAEVSQLVPDLAPRDEADGSGIAPGDRVDLAEGALRAMSLTAEFAPLVVIAGHGASTVNNPYDNGLDCGACGGHTGEANARVAVAILNDPLVREGLVARGISVPEDTWFVAAQHDTTTDEVRWFDLSGVPATHRDALAALQQDLLDAGRATRRERARRMGLDPDSIGLDAEVVDRSTDWAQVRPEWGLAGCAAFVIAPRHRTLGADLGGRAFLHSYDWHADDGFGVLELLMTAPMVVASWISLQYYGSTVENELFGSGNKTLHNVVGRIGVLEGSAGDLRSGLPWQSVHDGTRYQHEPVRLNVMIEAPLDAMNKILADHPDVAALVDHGWIHLLAIDDAGQVAHRYAGDLRWEPVAA